MNIPDLIEVGAAGSVGAVSRFGLDSVVKQHRPSSLPLGTIVINLTGSFLLGLLTGLVVFHGAPSRLTLVAGTGFCGGYTTFSTSSFETVRLYQQGFRRDAAINFFGTLAGALLAGGAGLALASI